MSVQSPKVYFDTSHLINIAGVRRRDPRVKHHVDAYLRLSECIENGLISVVFDPFCALEWVDKNASLKTATEIAEVMDSARRRFEFAGDSFAYQAEVIRELRRIDPELILPEFDAIWSCDTDVAVRYPIIELFKTNPELVGFSEKEAQTISAPTDWRSTPAIEHVKNAWRFKHKNVESFRERIAGHRAAFSSDTASLRNRNPRQVSVPERISWIKRYLRMEQIIVSRNRDANVDELLAAVDFDCCPAIKLYIAAHLQRVAASHAPIDSDVGDWASIAIVPYCDIFLTERNLRSFLHQADRTLDNKVHSDPTRVAQLVPSTS